MQVWQIEAQKEEAKRTEPYPSLREMINSAKEESSSPPVPVVLCGKTEQIGRGVIEGLKPEYEVVQFVTTPASGAVIIPALLTGTPPPAHADSSAIGSGNHAQPPRAVVLGGAFDEAAVQTLQAAVAEAKDARKVPWLRQDSSKPAPPIGPEYGKAMVTRVRKTLGRLAEEGKLDGEHGGDEWY